ncbi:hypothetical protein OOK31_38870 [Streptomyces sp. NBC_00249]|uniref:hypothetical protein n=1 Tax=Streptomyces sp. NBC_00249 TaxID=2975690 RepID=UPI00225570D3|nr:hypothetical protein [Streptomyces sp. NBC_00249]MCX5199773.1 hypothetical protein [Streptomyces sp. NBC_00249]
MTQSDSADMELRVGPGGSVKLNGSARGLGGCGKVLLAGPTVVVVDPADLRAPVHVAAPDLETASWALRPLLGDELFDSVCRAVRDASVAAEFSKSWPASLGATWEHVARLGSLLWAEQWTPLPLDQNLLDIDVAAAAATCQTLGTDDLAGARYRRCWPQLVKLGERLHDGPGLASSREICTALIHAPNYLWGLPSNDAKRFAKLAGAAREASAAGFKAQVTTGFNAHRLPQADNRCNDTPAPDDGPNAGVQRRTFSVDWHMVPRAILDPAENTIRAVYESGLLNISVLAARDNLLTGQRPARLGFRVLAADRQADATGFLTLNQQSQVYEGTVALTTALACGSVVDVFAEGLREPPPTRDPDLARIRRRAAWALALERVAKAGCDTAARDVWRDAATHWSTVADGLNPPSPGEAGDGWWWRTALRHTAFCWERAGEPEQVALARKELNSEAKCSEHLHGDRGAGLPGLAERAVVDALPKGVQD